MPQAFSFAFAVNGNAGEHAETQAQAQELEDGDGAELPADTGKSQAACATEPQQPAASPKQVSSHQPRLEASPWQSFMLIWQRLALCLRILV